jgi:hypothetical protein
MIRAVVEEGCCIFHHTFAIPVRSRLMPTRKDGMLVQRLKPDSSAGLVFVERRPAG